MTTATVTNKLGYTISYVRGNTKTNIKIRLDDDCKNGHEDFSITCDIYEKNGKGTWVDAGGGADHDHILKLQPGLQLFVDLHLSTWQGIPMHCIANGFYWLAGYLGLPWIKCHGSSGSYAKTKEQCLEIFKSHLRIGDDLLPRFLEVREPAELQIAIEDAGLVSEWRRQANEAIAILEGWSGEKFESKATRGSWVKSTSQERAEVQARREGGYYRPESIAARDEEKRLADIKSRRQKLLQARDRDVRKIDANLELELFMLENSTIKNWIYYDHTNQISVNWTTTEKLAAKEEFDGLQILFKDYQTALFPTGVQLEWREKPKY